MCAHVCTCIHTQPHTPDSISMSHLFPFLRSSLQVCSRTDTGGQSRPPAVLNISYRSSLGTKTSVRAEAETPRRRVSRCGEAPHPDKAPGDRTAAPRKWCSGEQEPLAEGRGEAARKEGGEGVSRSMESYAPPDLCSLPTPTRLGVGTFPPPLSLPAWGKGWHQAPDPGGVCRVRIEGRARWLHTERKAWALPAAHCPRPTLGNPENQRVWLPF